MSSPAVDRLHAAVSDATRAFGAEDPRTLDARLALGLGFRERERDHDAYAELTAVAQARARVLGPDHPDTFTARHEAALSRYHLHLLQEEPEPEALPEAIRQMEAVTADRERVLGWAHPDTLDGAMNLGAAYGAAGRHAEAEALESRILPGWERVVADHERALGPDHLETQFRRRRLAWELDCRGRRDESLALRLEVRAALGRIVADRTARLGPVHPGTVEARIEHALAHGWTGYPDDELRLNRELVADHERILGPSHPRTLRALAEFARTHHTLPEAGDLAVRIIHEVAAAGDEDVLSTVRNALILSLGATDRRDEVTALIARYPPPGGEDDRC
ncbi:tetratricopeptide repeat protein [Actinoplanes sp. NPDC049802]|uniref:tetratricopeptide repeat protein n=1 Tax=Actinoplanes sp. NPDC049802 TaxID=3154742 RepID=UPI0033D09088